MTGFTAEWLALREPVDARARRDATGLALRGGLGGGPLEIVDLGAGTGANLRFLAPLIGGEQRWTLVEHDARLIAAQRDALTRWAAALGAGVLPTGDGVTIEAGGFTCSVTSAALDLEADLARLPLPAKGLVTASALLDLVSEPWLARLVDRIAATRTACLFALSYDGRIELAPPHPDDALVHERFDAHQRRDKGFGAALGPTAPARVAVLLEARGYTCATAPSDWRAGSGDRAFATALIDGWVAAAIEGGAPGARDDLDPAARAAAGDGGADIETRVRAWGDARREALARGDLALMVGHTDLTAVR